jgi:hypothetical protein
MFTNHCDIHSGILSGWHKDDGMTAMEGGYFGSPAYHEDDCQVYKVAIYLQDHVVNTAGLSVRKGSHRFADLNEGPETYLKTRAGDVVVFDVRLTHSGQQDCIPIPIVMNQIKTGQGFVNNIFGRQFSYSKLNNSLKFVYDRVAGTKLSLFFTFGLPNDFTIKFSTNNMKRQVQQTHDYDIFLPQKIRDSLLSKNLLLAEDYFPKDLIRTSNET